MRDETHSVRISCDGCEAPIIDMVASSTDAMGHIPHISDHLTLLAPPEDGNPNAFAVTERHFCGLDCLSRWIEGQKPHKAGGPKLSVVT